MDQTQLKMPRKDCIRMYMHGLSDGLQVETAVMFHAAFPAKLGARAFWSDTQYIPGKEQRFLMHFNTIKHGPIGVTGCVNALHL